MKYEARPTFVDAMQWNGDPETLGALVSWIMSNRVSEELETYPAVTFTRRWNSNRDGEPQAQIEGHRWSVFIDAGSWVIKDGARVTYMSDATFKDVYKQVRSKR